MEAEKSLKLAKQRQDKMIRMNSQMSAEALSIIQEQTRRDVERAHIQELDAKLQIHSIQRHLFLSIRAFNRLKMRHELIKKRTKQAHVVWM